MIFVTKEIIDHLTVFKNSQLECLYDPVGVII